MPELDGPLMADWARAVEEVWQRSSVPWLMQPGPGTPMNRDWEAEVRAERDRRGRDWPLYLGWLEKAAMTWQRVAAVIQLGEEPSAQQLGGTAGQAANGYAGAVLEHTRHLYTAGEGAAESSPRARVIAYLGTPDKADTTDTTHPGKVRDRGSVGSVPYVGASLVRVSTRDVHRRFEAAKWCRSSDDVRTVLTDLAALGWLDGPHRSTGPDGGRPTEHWYLHPQLAHHYARMMETPR
jgi:hypothetical protein